MIQCIWIMIFCYDTNIDITSKNRDIMVLWFFWNGKFNIQKKGFFYDSLPKSKPFQSYLLNNGTHEESKSSIFVLCCFACFQSHIFQGGSTKACAVPISCQLTQTFATADKNMVLPFFTALLCPSVVCNDASYCVSYRGTCINIWTYMVSWEFVSLLP